MKAAMRLLKIHCFPALPMDLLWVPFAAAESLAPVSSENIQTVVTNNAVTGTKIAVPDVEAATHVMVLCKNGNNVELRSVALDASGVSVTLQANIDPSKSFYQIDFNDARIRAYQ